MAISSPKSHYGVTAILRSLSSMAVSVGALALFLVVASLILVSYPVGLSLRGYLLGEDHLSKAVPIALSNNLTKLLTSPLGPLQNDQQDMVIKQPLSRDEMPDTPAAPTTISSGRTVEMGAANSSGASDSTDIVEFGSSSPSGTFHRSGNANPGNSDDGLGSTNSTSTLATVPSVPSENSEKVISASSNSTLGVGTLPSSPSDKSEKLDSASSNSTPAVATSPPASSDNPKKVNSRSCDLYHGKWIYDAAGPLYTNNSCPIITQMQNCQGNGRPDKDYENWRWKPEQCDLPRFDARKFLELMRGKTLAFIGDSVARNQMESMMCILWQAEVPKNRGNRRMQRWYFRSTSTSIVRIWSSWLVHSTPEPFQSIPEGVTKVHLDIPDETFMEFLPRFDVLVLSSGHWFAKQSVYILNNTIVGGQLWWPKGMGKMKVNNIEAFGISVETIMTAIASHPNFTNLAIVRSFSPDHYEGGAWNTGGSCTGKVRPVTEVVRNGFTDIMHEKQVTGFERAVKKARNGAKLRLMDITEPFGYRADGHPGPYRSLDPNKLTKRGPNGEPPPQDCLHWCMPGPIDTWNEIMLEIIRREFERA